MFVYVGREGVYYESEKVCVGMHERVCVCV